MSTAPRQEQPCWRIDDAYARRCGGVGGDPLELSRPSPGCDSKHGRAQISEVFLDVEIHALDVPKAGYRRSVARTVAGVAIHPDLMSQQNAARTRRTFIEPNGAIVLGFITAVIGGMVMTDETAIGVLILAIGATVTQVGIIATAVEWAIRRTRES